MNSFTTVVYLYGRDLLALLLIKYCGVEFHSLKVRSWCMDDLAVILDLRHFSLFSSTLLI